MLIKNETAEVSIDHPRLDEFHKFDTSPLLDRFPILTGMLQNETRDQLLFSATKFMQQVKIDQMLTVHHGSSCWLPSNQVLEYPGTPPREIARKRISPFPHSGFPQKNTKNQPKTSQDVTNGDPKRRALRLPTPPGGQRPPKSKTSPSVVSLSQEHRPVGHGPR